MSSPAAELERALAELERRIAKKKQLDHHLVRSILLGLGDALARGAEREADDAAARVEIAVEPVRERWDELLAFEMELACTEHCQSVDPKFLNHPRYDFDYTLAARERLEARLVAAGILGWELPEEWRARVQKADALLQPYLRSREDREPLN